MFAGAPFGIKTLARQYQHVMDEILKDNDAAASFVDDVVIGSRTLEEHKEDVAQTIRQLTANGIVLNWKKCEFGKWKIQVTG